MRAESAEMAPPLVLLASAVLVCLARLRCVNGEARLLLASVVFRHGDRSPVGRGNGTFPTDPYKEKDWPQGYGQLSTEGVRQQYLLGEILRGRYVSSSDPALQGFMNENYTRVEMYVRSTDVDRTLMSAESQLATLFPPTEDQRANVSIAWQPIPVHTVSKDNDNLLRGSDGCPTYTQLREKDKETQEYRDIEEENKHFFSLLETETGLKKVNLSNVWIIEDTIAIENVTEGKTPPKWANDTVIRNLHNLSDYSMTLMFNSRDKNRFTAGLWLQKVLSDMKAKVSGNETLEKMKLFLYSAHDTTVAAMASALGVFSKTQPPYASALFVELYQDNNEYYVKLFNRTGPYSGNIVPLNFPAGVCQDPTQCTLQEFETFVSPLFPDDWHRECGLSEPSSSSQTYKRTTVFLGVVVGILVVVLVVVFVLWIINCRRRSRYRELRSTLKPDELS